MDKKLLYKFFEGKTSFEEETKIKSWLESSKDNERIFFNERKLYDSIILLGPDVQKVSYEKSKYLNVFKEIMKIAAVIIITIGVVMIINKKNEKDSYQTIYVPSGQRINLTLSDGTNVWLNAKTTFTYPAVFNKKERKVVLDGEAYFDVTENKDKPFIVKTKDYNVKVLGTEFNVDAYSSQSKFETMLVRGKVNIFSDKNPMTEYALSPGNKIYLKDGKLEVVSVSDYDKYRWKEGLICFKNEPFDKIMQEFEKYYDIKIVVENNNVNKHRYTGKFRQCDGVEYALNVLQRDISYKYKRDEEKGVIYIK